MSYKFRNNSLSDLITKNVLFAAIVDPKSAERTSDSICISQKNFAIGICVAGLLLMLCVVAAILCLLARRRKKTTSHLGSSIYSGPYTNTAYSHTNALNMYLCSLSDCHFSNGLAFKSLNLLEFNH
ncbi:hypothetical protein NQ317_006457 [Molorchus minor]|uniref:Uncharacterized protein n=1 Tax=Molorchus minor TaxID=1323400 RepID=A0ABQ9ITM5_9CUCU|nr:hypothetical protein NQ317_006457 [Molorchus minor]